MCCIYEFTFAVVTATRMPFSLASNIRSQHSIVPIRMSLHVHAKHDIRSKHIAHDPTMGFGAMSSVCGTACSHTPQDTKTHRVNQQNHHAISWELRRKSKIRERNASLAMSKEPN